MGEPGSNVIHAPFGKGRSHADFLVPFEEGRIAFPALYRVRRRSHDGNSVQDQILYTFQAENHRIGDNLPGMSGRLVETLSIERITCLDAVDDADYWITVRRHRNEDEFFGYRNALADAWLGSLEKHKAYNGRSLARAIGGSYQHVVRRDGTFSFYVRPTPAMRFPRVVSYIAVDHAASPSGITRRLHIMPDGSTLAGADIAALELTIVE